MSRPKRKATINKSYTDNLDDIFEDLKIKKSKQGSTESSRPPSVSNSSSTGGSSPTTTQSSTNNPVNINGAPSRLEGSLLNWQPLPAPNDYFSTKLSLDSASIDFNTKTLHCHLNKKKLKLTKGDFIYMVSEPAGEPYYIGKIMGFKSKSQSINQGIVKDVKNYEFQIQWFYRPRDISKNSNDSRLLFASMHTDSCPLLSFRGLVTVTHKDDIKDLDRYKLKINSFYFDKLYDRYMMKFYDVLSTSHLLEISSDESKSRNFLIALNKRFEYISVEPQITKFLINGFLTNSCTCELCGQWCSNQDSVCCADCNEFYHMYCLDPPLLKKPSRGFSWHCEKCTKKHLQQYKSNKILMLSSDNKSSNQQELELEQIADMSENESSNNSDEELISDGANNKDLLPRYELLAIEFLKNDKLSLKERRLVEEWSMRYLGMHTKLEDALDLDDRSPYPRASTRIGAKHQANYIPECIDHPIVYYDSPGSNTNGGKKKKKNGTPDNEKIKPLPIPKEYEELSPNEFPDWLQPRPKGYIERGVDDGQGETCTLLWKPQPQDINDNFQKLDAYVEQCKPIATRLGLSYNSPNFMDKILNTYFKLNGDIEKAMIESNKLTKSILNEPILKPEEIELFEQGVRKFGSELYPVYKMVKTVPSAMIVRFYYIWKKTAKGREIWGNFEGRLKKKHHKQDDEGQPKINYFKDDDDSGYDDDKVNGQVVECKYCHTQNSIMWFRLTGCDPNEKDSDSKFFGLCFRCAKLWRRYAVVWEDPIEIEKKVNKAGKKKIEYELFADYEAIIEYLESEGSISSVKSTKKKSSPTPKKKEDKKEEKKDKIKDKSKVKNPDKKEPKVKTETKSEKRKADEKLITIPVKKPKVEETILNPVFNKDYIKPKEMNLTLVPIPNSKESKGLEKLVDFSKYAITINDQKPHESSVCDICNTDNDKDIHRCESCSITVHSSCSGITHKSNKWICDKCVNDINPVYSQSYQCSLCFQSGGYLRPIQDSGKWCHLKCFMFNYKLATVANSASLKRITQNLDINQSLLFSLITNNFEIHNVDEIFINNYQKSCNICENSNGSLVGCEYCTKTYHVTCAETNKFKLGFKLVPGSGTKIGDNIGKLEPILMCCKSEDALFYDFRVLGKRSSTTKENVPLIKLFLEDFTKNTNKLTGGHFKATHYLNLIKNFIMENNENITDPIPTVTNCKLCHTTISPMWWEGVCQTCHHNENQPVEDDEDVEDFLNIVKEPLAGEQFGIDDDQDKLTNIYTSLEI